MMAVEETELVVEPVEPVEPIEPVEPVAPTEPVESAKPKEPESKESFVEKWKGIIKDRLSGGDGDEDAGDEIPDDFVEAARKMNWSDEDTTKFAADYTDKQLKEMIPSLLGEAPAKAEETSDKTEETQTEIKPGEGDNSQEDDRLTQALDRIAALESERDGRSEKSEADELASFNQRASDLFDNASEEFEVFGKTDDLPKFPHNGQIIPTSPQMKARLEVYGMAEQLKEAGMSGDKALGFSLNAFKGANLAVETKRNVIKDLKEREQTLGGKRVSHEVAATGDLTGVQVLQAVARKHGVSDVL